MLRHLLYNPSTPHGLTPLAGLPAGAGAGITTGNLHYAGSLGPQLHHSYLHGGLTIEFIGELPYASCVPFVVLDATILVVQLALFCLTFSTGTATATTTGAAVGADGDTDSDDLENQLYDTAHPDQLSPLSREEALYTSYSGQLVVAHIDIFTTVRKAWNSHIGTRPAAAASAAAGTADAETDLEGATAAAAGGANTYGSTASTTETQQPTTTTVTGTTSQQAALDPAGTLVRLLRNFS